MDTNENIETIEVVETEVSVNVEEKETAKTKPEATEFPYKRRKLMSDVELLFYNVLNTYVSKYNLRLFSKVRLEDVVHVCTTGYTNIQKYRGFIKSRHVDFVVCDAKMDVLMVFELDDSSHEDDRAKETDVFKNQVFRAAGIPLYRIPTKSSYKGALEIIFSGYNGI